MSSGAFIVAPKANSVRANPGEDAETPGLAGSRFGPAAKTAGLFTNETLTKEDET